MKMKKYMFRRQFQKKNKYDSYWTDKTTDHEVYDVIYYCNRGCHVDRRNEWRKNVTLEHSESIFNYGMQLADFSLPRQGTE